MPLNPYSIMEEILRSFLGIQFGKEGITTSSNSDRAKLSVGTLIRKSDITVTLRHGEITKRYQQKVVQYEIL